MNFAEKEHANQYWPYDNNIEGSTQHRKSASRGSAGKANISNFFNDIYKKSLPMILLADVVVNSIKDSNSVNLWISVISSTIAGLSATIALFSLLSTRENAIRNTRLSIHLSIVSLVLEKAKNCNDIWIKTSDANNINDIERITREMYIAVEVINECVKVYEKSDPKCMQEKGAFGKIFWKQLEVHLRNYYATQAIPHSISFGHSTIFNGYTVGILNFSESGMEQLNSIDSETINTLREWATQPPR